MIFSVVIARSKATKQSRSGMHVLASARLTGIAKSNRKFRPNGLLAMTITETNILKGNSMTTSQDFTSQHDTSLAASDPALAARMEKTQTDLQRRYSADMNLWIFCRTTRCYRARDCRGDASDCIARYAPLVPEEVRDGARLLLRDEDTSSVLGSVETLLDDAEATEALDEWEALVMQAQQQEHG
jgi:hypothetical protein